MIKKLKIRKYAIISQDKDGSNPTNLQVKTRLEKMKNKKYYNKSSKKYITIDDMSIGKYIYDGYHNLKASKLKKRIAGNYDKILKKAIIDLEKSGKANYKNSNRGQEGFDYYNICLAFPIKDINNKIKDYRIYSARIVVRIEKNNYIAYDLDKIKEKKKSL